jgi:diguanylate cyclase (GGDEF)-like protein/PAS domain S-box-containing protein
MKSEMPLSLLDANEEVAALIEVLHQSGKRLEELTAGEVDTVADRDGRTFLLRRAQDHLRLNEAAKQAAILNVLPAHIALLDARGFIVSVNEAWRRFEGVNSIIGPDFGLGLDYLDVCDGVQGDGEAEARQVAAGIRSVLDGTAKSFSIEYAAHSPTQRRFYLLKVTPLADDFLKGAVVMHLDVTAHRETEESLRASELRFRQMAENIREVFWLTDPLKNQVLYVSPTYEDIWGRRCEDLYTSPQEWIEAIHPEDRERVVQAARTRQATGQYAEEYRIVRPDGGVRWIRDRAFPVMGDAHEVYRIAGVAEDITESRRAAQALRESERRFSDLLTNVELVSLMLDRDAAITYCNDYFLRLTGWRHEEIIGRNWFELFIPGKLASVEKGFADLIADESEARHQENEILTRSGERRLIRWNNSVLRSGAGDVIGTASIGEDITEQKRAEVRIKRLNRVYAVLSQISSLIIRVRDRDELFREACRIAVEVGAFKMVWIGEIDPQTLDGKVVAHHGAKADYLDTIRLTARDGAPHSDRPASRALRTLQPFISNDIATDPSSLEARHLLLESGHKSGGRFPLTVGGRPAAVIALFSGDVNAFDDEEIRLLLELAGNLSFALDHIEKAKKLDYLAYFDALTGLANQSLFLERLQQKLLSGRSPGRKAAVFVIDIERFKSINDAFGRHAGDELLKQVSQRLVQSGGGDASRFARIGADRFAIFASDMDNAQQVGRYTEQRLNASFRGSFQVEGSEVRLSAKAGIALFPDDGGDADTLLRNAEAALKKAKVSGARYLFFAAGMTERIHERLSLENRLRQALDNEEFVLHYQPKINLASGKLTSAEALIRWNDPRTSLVPPGSFIPILEETGLIHEVGRWALRKAIEEYLRWRAAGLPGVRIAVNVSPLQLRTRGFSEEIREAVGIEPGAAAGLELEITESVIMEDVKHSIEELRSIRALGVTIAIDDFGTGFSSLSHLAKLPVDTLKIDRSFIVDMTVGPQGLALVSTIINLAHSLTLKVVAEGVETEEQSRLLRLLRCDEMQGFLFSKPVPSDVFEAKFLAS